MDPLMIQSVVERVLQQIHAGQTQFNPYEVPIAVSARHVHLKQDDIDVLFGPSYTLCKRNDLSQPNQFAAEETVTIAGPSGTIQHVRVLGPPRKLTQVEVSRTDTLKLGLKAPIRQSGNISGSSPVSVIGPNGSLYLQEGLIVAQTHIHMAPSDAERFGVRDGQLVQVRAMTERPVTFDKVLIRVSSSYRLEMHIDTDEANAGWIQTGQAGILMADGKAVPSRDRHNPVSIALSPFHVPETAEEHRAEDHIFEGKLLSQIAVHKSTGSVIRINKSTIVTPLARDAARDLGKTIAIVDR